MNRIALSLAAAASLAACHRNASDGVAAADAAADRIPCAIGEGAAFAPACTIERVAGPQGLELMIRHPDGGFRRLLVTRDGRGVIAADGADRARVSVIGNGLIEVALGANRYRLPATVKPSPRA